MYAICCLLAVIIGAALQTDTRNEAQRKAIEYRQQSIQLNELAAHITSEADSERLIDQVSEMFKDELPPAWATQSVRRRLAHEEFKTATDISFLIPEQRIAEIWNRYIREIGAPDEAIVTAEEIHNLRDAQYATSLMLWNSDGNQSVWTMPNIVAVGNDGKVANGCRALEAIRVAYSMGNIFENVRGARKRVQEGVLVSDQLANRPKNSERSGHKAILMATVDNNPIRPAQQKYVREHGSVAFNRFLGSLFTELFPDEE